jgi:hypothetical protein
LASVEVTLVRGVDLLLLRLQEVPDAEVLDELPDHLVINMDVRPGALEIVPVRATS